MKKEKLIYIPNEKIKINNLILIMKAMFRGDFLTPLYNPLYS
jgi:hypothetical protein